MQKNRMKNIYGPVTAMTVLLAAVACSKDEDKAAQQTADVGFVKELNAAVEKTKSQVAPSGKDANANACLLGFATKLDEVLTLEDAAKITGRDVKDAKHEYQKVLDDSAFHENSYSWKTSRTEKMTVAGMTINRPMPDLVAVGGFRAMEVDYFKRSYRAIGADDKNKLDEQIDKSEDLKTKQQKETAHTLGGAIAQIAASYRPVEGIGEAASFNGIESRLYVIDRGVKFQVTVDVGEDTAVDEKKAIELARKVLARCP